MNKIVVMMLLLSLLLAGCTGTQNEVMVETELREQAGFSEALTTTETAETETVLDHSADAEQVESAATIYPLNDPIMENRKDAILAVALKEGDVYKDEEGRIQMVLKIYSYDKYDMVDISKLKAGDVLVTNSGEVEVLTLERREDGAVSVNGGLLEDGFDLVTDDEGVFYECGFNDSKNWYEIGEAIMQVSADFACYDSSDLEVGEVVYNSGNFLSGEIAIYDFTPYNTTVRVENGQIVEMNRVFTP